MYTEPESNAMGCCYSSSVVSQRQEDGVKERRRGGWKEKRIDEEEEARKHYKKLSLRVRLWNIRNTGAKQVSTIAAFCSQDQAGRPTASICHGAWMFCSAKVLKGRRATCFHAIKDDVENAGALYEDAPVVVDKNLITSRIPSDLPDFCKAILAQLKA